MEPVAQLSPAAKARIKALSGARPGRFILTLATTWLVIGVTVFAAVHFHNIFLSLACIYIIATRQNILALLIHEQTHYMGLNSRYGDLLVNLFAGYPLIGGAVENYAKIHLRHHRSFFTQQDPDFLRKNGPNWTVPMPARRLFTLFLQDLVGLSFVQFVIGKNRHLETTDSFRRRNPTPVWIKASFFLAAAALLTLFHGWLYFLIYWVVPLITVFQVIVRWGAICEHVYGEEGATVADTSPVILPTMLGNIFLPNLHFTMHSYHHYFPGVSFSKLPDVHKVFEEEGLVRTDQVFNGQFEYFKFVLTGTRDHQHAGLDARSVNA